MFNWCANINYLLHSTNYLSLFLLDEIFMEGNIIFLQKMDIGIFGYFFRYNYVSPCATAKAKATRGRTFFSLYLVIFHAKPKSRKVSLVMWSLPHFFIFVEGFVS